MGLDAQLLAELWRECEAGGWGLDQVEFREILISIGTEQNFGLAALEIASQGQQTEFFRGLRLGDLVLARACAKGNERGWERFVALYRQTLLRAAIAITGSETLGTRTGRSALCGALRADGAGWKTALSARILPGQGIADRLAADYAGTAICGSSQAEPPGAAAGGV